MKACKRHNSRQNYMMSNCHLNKHILQNFLMPGKRKTKQISARKILDPSLFHQNQQNITSRWHLHYTIAWDSCGEGEGEEEGVWLIFFTAHSALIMYTTHWHWLAVGTNHAVKHSLISSPIKIQLLPFDFPPRVMSFLLLNYWLAVCVSKHQKKILYLFFFSQHDKCLWIKGEKKEFLITLDPVLIASNCLVY